MFRELRELLCSGAIRRHQLGAKDLLTPTSSDTGIRCRNTVKKIPPINDICPYNTEKIEQKFQNYEKKYNYNC